MIRTTLVLTSLVSLLALTGCDEDKGIQDTGDDTTDTTDPETEVDAEDCDDGVDNDGDGDVDGDDSDCEIEYFDPVAVGFKYVGGWDSSTGELLNYFYGGKEYPSYVLLVLADIDYFSASDSAAQEGHYCEIVTSYYHASAGLTAETYDYGNGLGGQSVSLWDSWDGGLYFDETLMLDDACFNLDPDVYTDGMPVELFSGIHYGMGFGPISESIIELFGDSYKDYQDSLFGVYQAINHPDGSGGYDFIAYDWAYSNLYEWDTKTNELSVDKDGYLVPANVGDPNPQGYVQSGAYWYEDFPNLDLTMLQDGAK